MIVRKREKGRLYDSRITYHPIPLSIDERRVCRKILCSYVSLALITHFTHPSAAIVGFASLQARAKPPSPVLPATPVPGTREKMEEEGARLSNWMKG